MEARWKQFLVEGDRPSPRGGHTSIAVDSTLVVFGGHAYAGNGNFHYFNDTHVFEVETSTWHLIRCRGQLPPPRFGHSATVVGNRMFIFGGKGESSLLRDVHFLDLVEWTWVPINSTSTPPPARMQHSSVLVGRKIVVHGGWDAKQKCFQDLWVFDTDSFTWLNPRTAGIPPSPRYGHSLNLLPDGRILSFGGMAIHDDMPQYFNDFRQLDTETMVWSKPRMAGEVYPSSRYGHSFTILQPNQLIMFGGWGAGGLQSSISNPRTGAESLYLCDTQDGIWEPIQVPDEMPHRYGHTVNEIDGTLIVFGGWDGKQALGTTGRITFRGTTTAKNSAVDVRA